MKRSAQNGLQRGAVERVRLLRDRQFLEPARAASDAVAAVVEAPLGPAAELRVLQLRDREPLALLRAGMATWSP